MLDNRDGKGDFFGSEQRSQLRPSERAAYRWDSGVLGPYGRFVQQWTPVGCRCRRVIIAIRRHIAIGTMDEMGDDLIVAGHFDGAFLREAIGEWLVDHDVFTSFIAAIEMRPEGDRGHDLTASRSFPFEESRKSA